MDEAGKQSISLNILGRLLKNKNSNVLKIIRGRKQSGKTNLLLHLKEELECRNDSSLIKMFNPNNISELFEMYSRGDPFFSRKNSSILIDDIDRAEFDLRKLNDIVYYTKTNVYASLTSAQIFRENDHVELIIYPIYLMPFRDFRTLSGDRYDSISEIFSIYKKSVCTYNNLDPNAWHVSDLDFFNLYFEILSDLKDDIYYERPVEREESQAAYAYLNNSVGRILSPRDISYRTKLKIKAVKEVLYYLEDRNIIIPLSGLDEDSWKASEGALKYYMADYQALYFFKGTKGHPMELENMVAVELVRRYEHVYYGITIDFIVEEDEDRYLFQVIYNSEDRDAKIEALKAVDATEKYIIIDESAEKIDENSFKCLSIIEFMLQKKNNR